MPTFRELAELSLNRPYTGPGLYDVKIHPGQASAMRYLGTDHRVFRDEDMRRHEITPRAIKAVLG